MTGPDFKNSVSKPHAKTPEDGGQVAEHSVQFAGDAQGWSSSKVYISFEAQEWARFFRVRDDKKIREQAVQNAEYLPSTMSEWLEFRIRKLELDITLTRKRIAAVKGEAVEVAEESEGVQSRRDFDVYEEHFNSIYDQEHISDEDGLKLACSELVDDCECQCCAKEFDRQCEDLLGRDLLDQL